MSLFLLQIDLFGDDFNEVFTGSKVSAGMLLLSLKLFFFFFSYSYMFVCFDTMLMDLAPPKRVACFRN